MPQNPAQALAEAPASNAWTLDKRQVIGAALGLLCLGIILGARLAGGEPLVVERPVIVKAPCPECEEKRHATGERTEKLVDPEHSVPGDSSIPPEND